MSQVTYLPLASCTVMPWKNGGGTTTEIFRRDDPTDSGRFLWRISVADIGAAGPFSAFDGYRRVISVIQGEGMVLTIDGEGSPPLHTGRAWPFSGASEVDCRLIDGPIRDLNLIYAEGQVVADVSWHQGERWYMQETTEADVLVVFVQSGSVELSLADAAWSLQPLDTLVVERSASDVPSMLKLITAAASTVCIMKLVFRSAPV